MSQFTIYAVEPQLDGTEHVFGPDYAANMRLPFDKGWDHWAIYDGASKVFSHSSFEEVKKTCDLLNSTVVYRQAS